MRDMLYEAFKPPSALTLAGALKKSLNVWTTFEFLFQGFEIIKVFAFLITVNPFKVVLHL